MDQIHVDVSEPGRLEVGGLTLHPLLHRVEGPKGTQRLEPRIMQVLLVLARQPGHPVSRQALLDECWSDLHVTEDSLTRCIFRLRQSFREVGAAGLQIETIPKLGYRLVVEPPEPADAGASAVTGDIDHAGGAPGDLPAAPLPSARMARRLTVPALILAGIIAIAILLVSPAVRWTMQVAEPGRAAAPIDIIPVTTQTGRELYPALSPDGSMVVFATMALDGNLNLFLQSTRPGSVPVRMTEDEMHDFAPAWSDDGGAVAFLRGWLNRPCELFVMVVPAGPERRLADCGTTNMSSIAWEPGGTSLIFARSEGTGPSRLVRVDVAHGRIVPLPLPRAGAGPDGEDEADLLPALSPDGTRLAFMRLRPGAGAEVLIVDTGTWRERERIALPSAAISIAWTPGGRSLMLAVTDGARGSIWQVGLEGGTWRQVVPGLESTGRISVSSLRPRMVFERYQRDADILSVDRDGAVRPLHRSSALDLQPSLSPDGSTLAFVSNRTGRPETWLAPSGERTGASPERATFLEARGIGSVRWAADAKSLFFIAVTRDGENLYRLDIGRGGPVRLTPQPGPMGAPVPLPDGGLLLPAKWGRDPAIWSVPPDPAAGQPTLYDEAFGIADLAEGGRSLLLSGIKSRNGVLRPLDGGPDRPILLPEERMSWRNLVVCQEEIIFLRWAGETNWALMRQNRADGTQVRTAVVQDALGQVDITVDCSTGTAYLSHMARSEGDLMTMALVD